MDLFWSIFLAVLVADAIAILGVYAVIEYRDGAPVWDILKALLGWMRLLWRHYLRIVASIIFFGVVLTVAYGLARDFGLF